MPLGLAQSDSLQGIQADIMLHPCDAFTAYTLKKMNLFIINLLLHFHFQAGGLAGASPIRLPQK
jgi:hypothetical protein